MSNQGNPKKPFQKENSKSPNRNQVPRPFKQPSGVTAPSNGQG